MTDTIKLTVDWREADSEVPEQRQEAFTQQLLQALRASSAIEKADRVADPDVPQGGMGAQWLWGILTAEIPGNGIKLALQEVFDRLPGKPLDVVVEIDGRKMEIKNVRVSDLDSVTETLSKAAQNLKDVG